MLFLLCQGLSEVAVTTIPLKRAVRAVLRPHGRASPQPLQVLLHRILLLLMFPPPVSYTVVQAFVFDVYPPNDGVAMGEALHSSGPQFHLLTL